MPLSLFLLVEEQVNLLLLVRHRSRSEDLGLSVEGRELGEVPHLRMEAHRDWLGIDPPLAELLEHELHGPDALLTVGERYVPEAELVGQRVVAGALQEGMVEDGGPLLDGVGEAHLEEPGVLAVEVGDDAGDVEGVDHMAHAVFLGVADNHLGIGQEVEEHGLLASIWRQLVLVDEQGVGVLLCENLEGGHMVMVSSGARSSSVGAS